MTSRTSTICVVVLALSGLSIMLNRGAKTNAAPAQVVQAPQGSPTSGAVSSSAPKSAQNASVQNAFGDNFWKRPNQVADEYGSTIQPLRRAPERIPSSMQSNDDRQVIAELKGLLSDEIAEREFLLHQVGIPMHMYAQIKHQQKQVYLQLQQADLVAGIRGMKPDEFKAFILQRHVEWMQSMVGVGVYDQLQQLAFAPSEP